MTIAEARIGKRAKFVGRDHEFHFGERMGKIGTIVADANLDAQGTNFGGGTCFWQIDGEDGQYITGLEDLEAV